MTNHSTSGDASEKPTDSLSEIIRTVAYALLIALVFRTVFFQPFSIPSGSMKSTLLVGDYLFVSKYSYGYSKYSLPWGHMLPVSGRIFASDPERGDVIVFKLPSDNTTDYIKRLVGLPGDRIQMRDGRLYINGEGVSLKKISDYTEELGPGQNCSRRDRRKGVCEVDRYVETLPNGVQHEVLDFALREADNTREFIVPQGHYFFMGDNRDNSEDSRLALGFVPEENLIGRAEIVLLSSKGAIWAFWNWRSSRFFSLID